MNRREFTASLAALVAAPALPLTATAAAPGAAVPPGAYAWAQLIARAQTKCTPAMLARHLSLNPAQAQTLFTQMIRDNVLRAPGMAGVARAVQPINVTGQAQGATGKLARHLRDRLDEATQPPALVKDEAPGLGCAEMPLEEISDARPDEPVQSRPRAG